MLGLTKGWIQDIRSTSRFGEVWKRLVHTKMVGCGGDGVEEVSNREGLRGSGLKGYMGKTFDLLELDGL